MKTLKYLSILSLALIGALYGSSPALAVPILDSDLASFTVLGATTVTNVPTSTIVGDVGVWSSGGANAITGFNSSPGVAVSDTQVTGGLVHAGTTTGTPNAQAAQGQLTTARDYLDSLGSGDLLSADLAGLTLTPGVYRVPYAVSNLTGTLTLDGQGNANSAWVFQMDSSLITSPNSVVNAINTGSGAGVYWNVHSSATIDTDTAFLGNILALTSITMNDRATNLCGRALADTGQVSLIQNSLSGSCSGILAGSGGLNGGIDVISTPGGTTEVVFLRATPVPEPSTLALMGFGLAGLGLCRRWTRLR